MGKNNFDVQWCLHNGLEFGISDRVFSFILMITAVFFGARLASNRIKKSIEQAQASSEKTAKTTNDLQIWEIKFKFYQEVSTVLHGIDRAIDIIDWRLHKSNSPFLNINQFVENGEYSDRESELVRIRCDLSAGIQKSLRCSSWIMTEKAKMILEDCYKDINKHKPGKPDILFAEFDKALINFNQFNEEALNDLNKYLQFDND